MCLLCCIIGLLLLAYAFIRGYKEGYLDDCVEESYQESFNRPPTKNIRITYLTDTEEIKKFMEQRNK